MSTKYLRFEEIKDLSIEQLIERINLSEKLVIGEIKIVDLIFDKQSMTGVYVIFDKDDNPVYVGKTASRAILERFAAHLDLRPGAFMNSFLCALAGKRKQRNGPKATEEDINKIYEEALTHKIVFIEVPNCHEHRPKIAKIENLILGKIRPKYNTRKSKKEVDVSIKVSEIT